MVVLFLAVAVSLIVVVVILRVPSSRPDGCKRLCGWLGVYLDGDDLFLRALLPGSNVSSSRLGADMPRHENYHAQTHTHTLSHSRPLFVSGQKYLRMYHWTPCTSMPEGPCDRS